MKTTEPRTYTVEEPGRPPVAYQGFNRSFSPMPLYVAVLSVEGGEEVFALDNLGDALINLRRYLNARQEKYRVVGLYQAAGSA